MPHDSTARMPDPSTRRRPIAAMALSLGSLVLTAKLGAAPPPEEREVSFQRDVRPILASRCYACHGPDAAKREAELRLDRRESALAARKAARPAIVPGRPESSELFLRISAAAPEDRMPPADQKRPLSPGQVETLRRWIAAGAPWEEHWSLRPLSRPEPPSPGDQGWAHGPIDSFLARCHTEQGITPAPPADRRTLLRRMSFDLVGLPPSPEDLRGFEEDGSPDAEDRLVDRLLASPHHGERMAIGWLDLVRYADTVGYHGDQPQSISPYRDYVIDSFNHNKPFDVFTREQIAGDLLPDATLEARIATGYNRLNMTTEEGGAQAGEYLAKYGADRVRATSTAWLGATLGCAQCHDHKYDPYTSRDFYAFEAFFADVEEVGVYGGEGRRPPELMVPTAEQAAELAGIDAALQSPSAAGPDLLARKKQVEAACRRTLVTVSVKPRTVRVLPRGNWLDESGEVVEPAIPRVFGTVGDPGRRATRLDLAGWLTSTRNPLTPRVLANRLWKMLFGTGISRTLDDSGTQGELPVHPELLDWLASELVDGAWNVRRLLRTIMSSSAYRQSAGPRPDLRERDPENRWVARQSSFRVQAELIRDTTLATSGLLVLEVGGRSVKPYQPEGYYAHLNFPPRTYVSDTGGEQFRRGLYTHWQRLFLHPALLAFDAPSREECTADRPISSTPRAALVLLNDPSFVEAARALAARVMEEAATNRARLDRTFARVLCRQPTPEETLALLALHAEHLAHYGANLERARALISTGISPPPESLDLAEVAAWTSVARVLLNLGETFTRP